MATTKTTNVGLTKVGSDEYLKDYPGTQSGNMDLLDAELARDVADSNGYYNGRDLKEVLGASTFDDAVAALHTRASAANFQGLRRMDYLDVTPTSTTVNQGNAIRYRISDFDKYYNYGDKSNTAKYNILFVPDAPIDMTGSTYATNTSGIMWNTTNTNQGTADEANPYIASNLHKWELEEFLPALPTSLQDVLLNPRVLLETRYSASGTLTDSNGWAWNDLGKVFSPSETEVYGQVVWGTKGYSVGRDEQFGIFRLLRARGMRNSRCGWWLRSLPSGSSSHACSVGYDGHVNYNGATDGWVRPLPCFLVG